MNISRIGEDVGVENGVRIADLVVDRGLRDALWLMRWRLCGRPITEPACRKCGYYVSGLPEPRCPECGADLTKVGVTDPTQIKRWPLQLAAVIAWTAVILVMALWVSPRVVPKRFAYSRYVGGLSTSEQYNVFFGVLTGEYACWPWLTYEGPISRMQLRLSLRKDNQASLYVQITLATGTARVIRADGVNGEEFGSPDDLWNARYESHETLLKWMELIGLDTNRQDLIDEALELHAYMQAAQTWKCSTLWDFTERYPWRHFMMEPHTVGGKRELLPNWYMIGAYAVWFLIWLVGFWFIAFRGR